MNETTLTRHINSLSSLSKEEMESWWSLPAKQQPDWGADWLIDKTRQDLSTLPGLVDQDEVWLLRRLLADVTAGMLHVVQAGDCAEDPSECVPASLTRKVGLLDALATMMQSNTQIPVLRVGRIAGQFAKPRSQQIELVDGRELPAFRGHLVNGPEPTEQHRRYSPLRLLGCYEAASAGMKFLRSWRASWTTPAEIRVWTSHEALLLDYEVPLLRRNDEGCLLLTSTHWPWIGERTRQLNGAHVRLLSVVMNPVACKIGPSMTADELLKLCQQLDPQRTPGRLTLIARLGADRVADQLPALVAATRREGHPVIWMSDPMHANTVTLSNGRKTRLLNTVVREVRDFQLAVRAERGIAGGLHLETTPEMVTECIEDESKLADIDRCYTTLCDPRLNAQQARKIAELWNP